MRRVIVCIYYQLWLANWLKARFDCKISNELLTIRNNRWAAGGLKYTAGTTSAGSLYIEDLLVEADFGHPLPPVVWDLRSASELVA